MIEISDFKITISDCIGVRNYSQGFDFSEKIVLLSFKTVEASCRAVSQGQIKAQIDWWKTGIDPVAPELFRQMGFPRICKREPARCWTVYLLCFFIVLFIHLLLRRIHRRERRRDSFWQRRYFDSLPEELDRRILGLCHFLGSQTEEKSPRKSSREKILSGKEKDNLFFASCSVSEEGYCLLGMKSIAVDQVFDPFKLGVVATSARAFHSQPQVLVALRL